MIKKSKLILIFLIIILILLKTLIYSNELKTFNVNKTKSNNNFNFNLTKNPTFNFIQNNTDISISSSYKKQKGFLKLGISGIILTTTGVAIGVPSSILVVLLHQYINSPINSNNLASSLLEGLIVKPLAILLLIFGGALVTISTIMFILGIIFIPVGFANYIKLKKENQTTVFIDSINDDLRFGIKIKI